MSSTDGNGADNDQNAMFKYGQLPSKGPEDLKKESKNVFKIVTKLTTQSQDDTSDLMKKMHYRYVE